MGMVAILARDQDEVNKLQFHHFLKDQYEIWLWLAQWFLSGRRLKSFLYVSLCGKTSDPRWACSSSIVSRAARLVFS